jgi:hypothetical protein
MEDLTAALEQLDVNESLSRKSAARARKELGLHGCIHCREYFDNKKELKNHLKQNQDCRVRSSVLVAQRDSYIRRIMNIPDGQNIDLSEAIRYFRDHGTPAQKATLLQRMADIAWLDKLYFRGKK